jgi:2-polyprenyl-3-methyl-5-hydroxy-6-metoxy-1,4-benzoquinol methylase
MQCPACKSDIYINNNQIICEKNNHKFDIFNGIPLMYVDDDSHEKNLNITKREKLFYESYPFPNYEDFDSPGSLITKAQNSGFGRQINDELPFNIRILEAGCGTGQLTNYLSLANRQVFGVDLSYSSLTLGNEFKKRHNISRSSFYQMNLFKPIFKDESFHSVICNGVLHHTPEPYKGFNSIVKLLKKGGYIIVGLYNKFGRIPTHIRRLIFKLSGNHFKNLDSRLRQKDLGLTKKEIWFMDQYKNPHESTHTYDEVLRWFENTGIEYISSIPEIISPDLNHSNSKLFNQMSLGTHFSRLLTQITIALTLRNEGGFFIMIGKKK